MTMENNRADNAATGKKRGWAVAVVLAVLTGALPSVFLYAQNAYEVALSEVLLPLGVSVALSLACLLVCRLVLRDWSAAALLAAGLTALFLNFNFIMQLVDAVLPEARVRAYYLAAVPFVAAVLAAVLLLRHKPAVLQAVPKILCIALAAIFAVNIVTAVPNATRRLNAASFTAENGGDARADLPNLYYIVTDEYASFQELTKYYGYDNSGFHDFLTERGFCVSDESYNHVANTMRNMADNMQLQQVTTDDMVYADYVELFNNAPLYGILQQRGYALWQLGDLYPLPKLLEQTFAAADGGATTMNGETAADILLGNSMLMPLKSMLYWKQFRENGDMALFDYLDDPAHYDAAGGRAIFFYICSPHPPFYYRADGSAEEDEAKWTDWIDKSCYLGQLQYITVRLERSIDTILQNDPNAIILVQSDHGLRYHEDSERPHQFSIDQWDQDRILNALYFGGKAVDIHGQSGYNTWRTVLTELGLDYPLLPES